MKTYLNESKFYNIKRIKPNKVLKMRIHERGYGRNYVKKGRR